jgi:hypothetical protein
MPKQPALPRLSHTMKKKVTRREAFLAEMEAVVPWVRLIGLIEPHYPKAGPQGGRPRSRDVVHQERQRLVFRHEGACRRGCQQRCHAEGVPLARHAQPGDDDGKGPRRPGVGRPPARRREFGLGRVAIRAPLVRATMATAMSARRGRPRSRAPASSGA